uniref:(northern house mosquito) hypothetical protein n=1 Tax=Culex pipiens TaxID=7175 RepID=A0A8D8F2M7_CULPI
MAGQLLARPRALHAAQLEGCGRQDADLLGAAQARRKDRRPAAGARQGEPGRPRGAHLPARAGPDLRVLRVFIPGRDPGHDTAAPPAEPHHHPAHRADDRGREQEQHRPLDPEHHQAAQVARGGHLDRPQELAPHPGHRGQPEAEASCHCQQYTGFDRLSGL